nr:uncharacterized protein LOC123572873 [Macaca fascicularis]
MSASGTFATETGPGHAPFEPRSKRGNSVAAPASPEILGGGGALGARSSQRQLGRRMRTCVVVGVHRGGVGESVARVGPWSLLSPSRSRLLKLRATGFYPSVSVLLASQPERLIPGPGAPGSLSSARAGSGALAAIPVRSFSGAAGLAEE